MFIIEVDNTKDGLEKSLKKLKKKFDKCGVLKNLRKRREYTKPSVKRRETILKAKYINKKINDGI